MKCMGTTSWLHCCRWIFEKCIETPSWLHCCCWLCKKCIEVTNWDIETSEYVISLQPHCVLRWRRAWVTHVLKDKAEYTKEAVFELREGHSKKVEHDMETWFFCTCRKSFVMIGRVNGKWSDLMCRVRPKIECVCRSSYFYFIFRLWEGSRAIHPLSAISRLISSTLLFLIREIESSGW